MLYIILCRIVRNIANKILICLTPFLGLFQLIIFIICFIIFPYSVSMFLVDNYEFDNLTQIGNNFVNNYRKEKNSPIGCFKLFKTPVISHGGFIVTLIILLYYTFIDTLTPSISLFPSRIGLTTSLIKSTT